MKRGFTLIELLIVIAIIGILAGVVVLSVGDQSQKSTDATVKFELGQLRAQSIVYRDNSTNKNYHNFCGSAEARRLLSKLDSNINYGINDDDDDVAYYKTADTGCNSDDDFWVAYHKLKVPKGNTGYWCVDYLGVGREIVRVPTTNNFASTDKNCREVNEEEQ